MDSLAVLLVLAVVLFIPVVVLLSSFHSIGAAEVGLVTKRLGKKLDGDQLWPSKGEAGYQADLLMPGLRFKLWPHLQGRAVRLGPGARRTASGW